MGLFDYEHLTNEKYPIGTHSIFTHMVNNSYFKNIIQTALSIGENSNAALSLFNRPTFKITKNREDIYLLLTQITNVSTGKKYELPLFVNEESFFRRICTYKDSQQKDFYTIDDGVEFVVCNAINNPETSNSFKLIYSEVADEMVLLNELIQTESVNSEGEGTYSKYGFFNGNPIEIFGFYKYNKFTWLSLLGHETTFKPITSEYGQYHHDYKLQYLS